MVTDAMPEKMVSFSYIVQSR